ncbi:MAG: hypothetical protein PHY64_02755 [Eubacteriales bacterium]|nr:hypothetical protein [Eubacteriales bacterium]
MWKIRRWWKRQRTGRKLIWLAAAALFLMLASETLFNVRALTTAALTPIIVPLETLSCETDLTVERNTDNIYIENGSHKGIDLTCASPDLQLRTVKVSLDGEGVVSVVVFLKDEASAYKLVQVYSAYCVADDLALRDCYASAESAGTAGEVMVRLLPQGNEGFSVTGVTLNAPIPFQWQPFRMALAFAAAFALLCALFLRGLNMAYHPEKRVHRLIVALPLVGLMVFSIFLAQWIEPDTPLFLGVTDEEAASGKDTYAVLFETLRAGRLAVDKAPNGELTGLDNPYDQSERVAKNIRFSFDYAYDNGQYYIYYGVAPVLTVYMPYHLLTGRVPASRDATLLMGWLTIAMLGWAMCGMARRYAPGANVLMLSLGCVAAVFASGAMFLLASADFYYLAELSFVCFCAGAIGFGLHATLQPTRWLRYTQYALSGLCLALTAMSRPSALPMLFALLAPLFVTELVRRRARLREAVSFLSPALLGIGALLWYNAARFGSILDFGMTKQLTVTDMHWSGVRLSELAPALYHYLMEPLSLINRFPYIAVSYHSLPTVGRYVFAISNTGVLSYPVTWAAVLLPLAGAYFPMETPLLKRERRLTLWLPLLVSIPMMLVSYGLAGAILRYTCDFRIFYALVGALAAVMMATGAKTPERKALAAICILLCLLSLSVGFGMLFDNERDYILNHSPQVYYGFQRMFFPF